MVPKIGEFNYQSRSASLPAIANIERVPTTNVFEELAPILGFALPPSTIQLLEDVAPILGLSSVPVQIQVFELVAPIFGRISLPSNVQVLELDAPVFGFNSRPSHTQSLGKSIKFDIDSALVILRENVRLSRNHQNMPSLR